MAGGESMSNGSGDDDNMTSEDETTPKVVVPASFGFSTPTSKGGGNILRKKRRNDGELEDLSSRELLESLVNNVKQIMEDLAEVKMKMGGWDKKFQDLQQQTTNNTNKITQQTSIIQQQKNKIDLLEKVVEDLYTKTNSNNLIIKGLRTRGPNEAYNEVRKMCQNLGGDEPQINNIRRLGTGNNKIMVEFGNYDDKKLLFENASFLRGYGIGFENDLPPGQREIRNILLHHRREILDNKTAKFVKVLPRSLLLDGRDWYDYDRNTRTVVKRPPPPQALTKH
jgi:hypothetical protein